MIKKIVIVIVILTTLSFFDLVIFPPIIIKLLQFIVPACMLFLILIYGIYDKSYRFKRRFMFEISLIFCAVILSMFGAYYFHKQDFALTAVTQRFIYFLLFYPLLHILKPKPEELIEIIVAIGCIYAVLYLAQTILYPIKLYNGIMRYDRGTLRIAMAGSGFLFLAYLIGLSNFTKTYNLKYLLICLLSLVIFVLLGTRQVIAPAALVLLLNILYIKRIRSKFLTLMLIGIMAVPVYYLFKDIFIALFEVTQKQTANVSGDVRVRAAIFYLTDFFPNRLAYIIGNGVPSERSSYGILVSSLNKALGYYQSDIGIIGDFTYFGIFLVIAQITLYVHVMRIRLPHVMDFVKYYFFVLIITIFISGGVFGYAESVVIICILLYLIDISFYYDPVSREYSSISERKEELSPLQ